MGFEEGILTPVGKAMIPQKIRPGLHAYVKKAGYSQVPYSLFGLLFYCVLALFLVIYVGFVMPLFKQYALSVAFFSYFFSAAGILLLLAVAVMLVLHFFWSIKIYERTKELERILPDYLVLVSTNLKGGMSFEKSLWDAIKPEFGILASEIGLVSKKVMTGNEIVDALNEFIMKYKSPILRRNFQLVISEFESGGEVVDVIDRIIENLKKTQVLKKELSASTVTYMIFIGALVVVICPILFALSYQLFFLIQGFMSTIAGTGAPTQGALQLTAPEINPEDFRLFSVLAICIISLGSGMITSVIEKGDFSGIIKFGPLYLIFSLMIYFIASIGLSTVFASLQIL